MRQTIILSLITVFVSCNSNKKVNVGDIFIEGNIKNLPTKKVYLTEAHQFDLFLDSATYNDGTFQFHIIPKPGFIPFMASIAYIDSSSGKAKTLSMKNHILSDSKKQYSHTAFILERGYTKLFGIANVRKSFIMGTNIPISIDSINIKAGMETDLLFKTQMSEFGVLSGKNKDQNKRLISKYKEQISENPNSYYYLTSITQEKESYSPGDLLELLSRFNNDLQTSAPGLRLKSYINETKNSSFKILNQQLETISGKKKQIFLPESKLTMLVFWASWCGPCRKEIPMLKKINAELTSSGLRIVSISIDTDKKKWESAVLQENMEWDQYIIDIANIETFKKNYRFSSIPATILIDNHLSEIDRFFGFDPGITEEQRVNQIKKMLTK